MSAVIYYSFRFLCALASLAAALDGSIVRRQAAAPVEADGRIDPVDASDGSLKGNPGALLQQVASANPEDDVYNIHFIMSGHKMCVEAENSGCTHSNQACRVTYCKVTGEIIGTMEPGVQCTCMRVKVKQCQNDEGKDFLQILTEAKPMREHGESAVRETHFWRAFRVSMVDQSPWGTGEKDAGKDLETSVICEKPEGCHCEGREEYHWKLEDNKIKWASSSGLVAIGPSPLSDYRSKELMTVRGFNLVSEMGDLTLVKLPGKTTAEQMRDPQAEDFEEGSLIEMGPHSTM